MTSFKKALAAMGVAGLIAGASAVQAATFAIGSFATSTSGFRYSLFHKGTADGAMTGDILGWMQLDNTWTGSSHVPAGGIAFYDEGTGQIEFKVNLFSSSAFTTQIGSAIGKGVLPAASLALGGPFSLDVLGHIDWEVTVTDLTSSLASWLSSTTDFTTYYADRQDYGVSPPANSISAARTLSLWGAKGVVADINAETSTSSQFKKNSLFVAAYPTAGNQVGTDLVIEMGGEITSCPSCNPVPEPATMVLLGTGLVGLIGYGWRRNKTA